MKRFIVKHFESERGNILVIVVFILLCCTIIVNSTMYITFNRFKYSQMYKNSSNIYYLTLSATEKAVNHINNIIYCDISKIANEISKELSNDTSNITLKNLLEEKITNKINTLNVLYYKTIIGNKEYTTTVRINLEQRGIYNINSKTKLTNGNEHEISAKINLVSDIKLEKISVLELPENIDKTNITFYNLTSKNDYVTILKLKNVKFKLSNLKTLTK